MLAGGGAPLVTRPWSGQEHLPFPSSKCNHSELMALTAALISVIHTEVLKLICCYFSFVCVCVFLKLTGTDNLVSPFCHLMFWHVAGTFFVLKIAFSGRTEWLFFF